MILIVYKYVCSNYIVNTFPRGGQKTAFWQKISWTGRSYVWMVWLVTNHRCFGGKMRWCWHLWQHLVTSARESILFQGIFFIPLHCIPGNKKKLAAVHSDLLVCSQLICYRSRACWDELFLAQHPEVKESTVVHSLSNLIPLTQDFHHSFRGKKNSVMFLFPLFFLVNCLILEMKKIKDYL